MFINLVFSVALPVLVLSKLSSPDRLGALPALFLALSFPLGYGVWDFLQRRRFNFIVAIGLASTLLTGGFAIMQADGIWFAIKEASVPLVIGLMVALSQRSKRPMVREFIYNDQILNVAKIDSALDERGVRVEFNTIVERAGWLIAASFLCSAVLNFLLARWIITAPGGSEEFNQQFAKMNLLSWPIIVIPSMVMMVGALWMLLGGIKRLTGLTLDEVLNAQPSK